MGLVAPRHVGSSQTRARTRVPCIDRWILNHCATREALRMLNDVESYILFCTGTHKLDSWSYPYLDATSPLVIQGSSDIFPPGPATPNSLIIIIRAAGCGSHKGTLLTGHGWELNFSKLCIHPKRVPFCNSSSQNGSLFYWSRVALQCCVSFWEPFSNSAKRGCIC